MIQIIIIIAILAMLLFYVIYDSIPKAALAVRLKRRKSELKRLHTCETPPPPPPPPFIGIFPLLSINISLFLRPCLRILELARAGLTFCWYTQSSEGAERGQIHDVGTESILRRRRRQEGRRL